MKKIYPTLSVLLFLWMTLPAHAQCPRVTAMFINGCGEEARNEFLIVEAGASGFAVADLQLSFDANSNAFGRADNDINIDLDNHPSDPTPCPWQRGNPALLGGCPQAVAVGPGDYIPPHATVVIQTSAAADRTYDFSALCARGGCLYVLSNGCARESGAFSQSGSGNRTTRLSIRGSECSTDYTYAVAQVPDRQGAYWLPPNTFGAADCMAPPLPVLPAPLLLTTSIRPPTCTEAGDGRLQLVVRAGTPPYRIEWADGSTAAVRDSIPAGRYAVQVSDGAGCRWQDTLTLAEPAALQLSCMARDSVSGTGARDGRAQIELAGGTAPYVLRWRNAVGTDSLTAPAAGTISLDSLAAGSYTLTLTDARGCRAHCSFRIGHPACSAEVSALSARPPRCRNSQDGQISLTVSGNGPFSYLWSGDTLQGNKISGLGTGTYRVTIVDGAYCETALSIPLMVEHPLTVDCQTRREVSRPGSNDGEIVAAITDGFADFQVALSGPVNRSTVLSLAGEAVFSRLVAGSYRVSVLDRNNCREECSLLLASPPCDTARATVERTLCADDSLLINGRRYDRSRPTGREVLKGAAANGCDSVVTVRLQFREPATVGLRGSTAVCAGAEVTLGFSVSGGGPLDLRLTDGNGMARALTGVSSSTTTAVRPDSTTTYRITEATDPQSGCAARIDSTALVRVSRPKAAIMPVHIFENYTVSCPDREDGAVTTRVEGGVGPYTYAWSNGKTTSQLSGLAIGSYSLTVTDALGCSATDTETLLAPEPLRYRLQTIPPACGEQLGAVLIEAMSGGIPSYGYRFAQGTAGVIDGFPARALAPPGDNRLQLHDAYGCRLDTLIQIPAGEKIDIATFPTANLLLGDSVRLTAETALDVVSVSWSPSEGVTSPGSLTTWVTPLRPTRYTVEIEDRQGCVLRGEVKVNVDSRVRVYVPTAFSPNADGKNDFLQPFHDASLMTVRVFRVFNRWGMIVYEAGSEVNNLIWGWDGNFYGIPQNAGTYTYYMEVELKNGYREVIRGASQLMR